jgi:hypothetical protein
VKPSARRAPARTILNEPLLQALHRPAQEEEEEESARRYGFE